MLRIRSLTVVISLSLATPALAAASSASLRGSPASMVRQNQVAKESDFSFLRNSGQVRRFVGDGYLVPIEGNADYQVHRGVSYPYGRPQLKTFLERLGAQYREACGERLVVTSLTRPLAEQPNNAHPLSVHPAGMAADLRISQKAGCREWLEDALLDLERRELLDVTRERRPPHYHIAVFPEAYDAYVQSRVAEESARAAAVAMETPTPHASAPQEKDAARKPSVLPAAEDRRPNELGRLAVITLFGVSLAANLRRRRARRTDDV